MPRFLTDLTPTVCWSLLLLPLGLNGSQSSQKVCFTSTLKPQESLALSATQSTSISCAAMFFEVYLHVTIQQ